MLKQTVSYEDFNGDPATDVLYFNFSKSEISDNLHLIQKFEELGRMFEGPERNLSVEEINKLLSLVKEVMRLSYGIKSEDGKRFIKGDQQWLEFTQTAAYDAFLMSLFTEEFKANEFLMGVFPRDMIADAMSKLQEQGKAVEAPQELRVVNAEVPEKAEDNRPAYIREDRKPTNTELQAMSRDELVAAMQFSQNKK